jgi:hypothetical protein
MVLMVSLLRLWVSFMLRLVAMLGWLKTCQ